MSGLLWIPQFPDWKRIGRQVGKRLRDILIPPTDTGPSREDRLAQRLQDVFKGFAYFDTVDELISWRPWMVDPLQRANTPLLPRSAPTGEDSSLPKSKVLLCHDYRGNYQDYEGVRPPKLESELYSCDYLQFVDTLIYFSHKLVCVPPPTWTNTLHRSGVKALGTFILEPQTPNIEQLLAKRNGRYPVADQLALMAGTFGFDGWLLNIEKEFATNVTEDMIGFIKALRQGMEPACERLEVIWYDALTVDNKVDYQNALTPKNLEIARSASALFTNYRWTEKELHTSKYLAEKIGIPLSDIYFGVDLWAQNTNMAGPPRITYPVKGGGGTNTGYAMKILSGYGFSTAVFAPAWPYEHFSAAISDFKRSDSIAKNVDRSLWTGSTLWDELDCDCQSSKPHHTMHYKSNPIIKYAFEYPAGSSHFFESAFGKGFKRVFSTSENHLRFLSLLGAQGPSPNLFPMSMQEWEAATNNKCGLIRGRIIYGELLNSDDTTLGNPIVSRLRIITKVIGAQRGLSDNEPSGHIHQLPLYTICIENDCELLVQVEYQRSRTTRDVEIGLYLVREPGPRQDLRYNLPYKPEPGYMQFIQPASNACHLPFTQIGIYCKGHFPSENPLPLIDLMGIRIRENFRPFPQAVHKRFTVKDIRIIQRRSGPYLQRRIAWDCNDTLDGWPSSMPLSEVTWPFSHFSVSLNGRFIGNAYACEFPLLRQDVEEVSIGIGEGMMVGVHGHTFGEVMMAAEPVTAFLPWSMYENAQEVETAEQPNADLGGT